MRKNDIIPLSVTGISSDGNGVGRAPDGTVVFVPCSAVGDELSVRVLKLKASYAYGKIEKIVAPSADRAEPGCEAFPRCGGCAFRHLKYGAERRAKREFIEDALKRIAGLDVTVEDFLYGEPDGYRDKAEYPLFPGERGVEVGFYASRSHRGVPVRVCPLQPEEFSAAALAVRNAANSLKIPAYDERTGRGVLRHLFLRKAAVSGEIMAVLVANPEKIRGEELFTDVLRETLGEKLRGVLLNVNRERTNVILGERCRVLYGDSYITDTLCGNKIRLSPHTFYQVNHDMAEAVYRKVEEYLEPAGKTVLDLYCGAGTIALFLARRAREVIGVESVAAAVEDAERNAELNGIINARFIRGDCAEAVGKLAAGGVTPDAAVLDPPRKGCGAEVLRVLCGDLRPERVVYVSCEQATFARDAAALTGYGYALSRLCGADMFPRTRHTEVVALFSRGEEP